MAGFERHSSDAAAVIALPCSGAGGAMWQALRAALGDEGQLLAVDLHGTADGPTWSGDGAFSLEAEAAPIIRLIDGLAQPVHLVGHSYGGAVALHVAAARPERVASLTLYEPACFDLLQPADGIEIAEINWLARDVESLLARGDRRGAMKRFVNYWGGAGAWASLADDAQRALMRWAPKASLDFHALLGQRADQARYEALDMPCSILSGEISPDPVREIASILSGLLPNSELTVLAGAGHMAPLTDDVRVAALMASHIRSHARPGVEQLTRPSRSSRVLEISAAK